ncbi:sigma-54-dependent transcriptional regulator [Aliiroseovarius sp. CAU 1755]
MNETGKGRDDRSVPEALVSAENSHCKILIVTALATEAQFPQQLFDDLHCTATYTFSLTEAAKSVARDCPDLVLLSLTIGKKSTLQLLSDLRKRAPETAVVAISQSDQINDAAEAMRLGAVDCLFFPFTQERLRKTVTATLRNAGAIAPQRRARGHSSETPDDDDKAPTRFAGHNIKHGMILSDIAMEPVLKALNAVSVSVAPVFIQGETGTGKELLARAIHAESGRAEGKFVVVDCARLDPDTLGSEIFGHKRGAFPAAHADKIGAAQAADGGTLFLDEIAHTDLRVQKQLMRFLEAGEILPLGETHPLKVDTRIICATTSDAQAEIKAGRLREDLYFRLHVVPITLPALRNRGQDIVAIANTKLVQIAQDENRNFRRFAPDAMNLLLSHPWPGNVRQLINVIWNVVLLHDGEQVTIDMLPADFQAAAGQAWTGQTPPNLSSHPDLIGRSLAEIERIIIEDTIRAEGGSVPKAAQVLGVSPSTIYRKRESWFDHKASG